MRQLERRIADIEARQAVTRQRGILLGPHPPVPIPFGTEAVLQAHGPGYDDNLAVAFLHCLRHMMDYPGKPIPEELRASALIVPWATGHDTGFRFAWVRWG